MPLFFHNKEKTQDVTLSEDAILVDKAKSGDSSAFGELVEKYSNFVYRTVFFDVGNPQDAQDISQEVFIKAYKALSGFRYDSEFSTWIFRIAKNTVFDFLRKKTKNKTISVTDMTGDDERKDFDIPDPNEKNDPEKCAISNETRRIVNECIKELSEEHREVIILRDIEGMSYAEISDILSLEEGTVKSRLSRARNALKKKLESKNVL